VNKHSTTPEDEDDDVDLSNLDDLTADGKVDNDAVKALVESTLADVPEFKGTAASPPPGGSGADFTGAGGAPKQWTREAIAKLSADEYEEHKEEIFAQLGAGTK